MKYMKSAKKNNALPKHYFGLPDRTTRIAQTIVEPTTMFRDSIVDGQIQTLNLPTLNLTLYHQTT